MKAIPIVLPALCVGLATPPAVNAQSLLPLSVEGHAGVSLPMGDFGDLANPSYGLGATVVYDLAPMIGIRAGYNYQRFGVDEEESGGADAEYTDSGFALGLELNPVLTPGLDLLLHADAILHQFVARADVQIAVGWEVQASEWSVTSDHRFGFDVGAGLAFPVGPRVSIVPRVRYRRYNAESDFGRNGESGEDDISYFAGGLGIRVQL